MSTGTTTSDDAALSRSLQREVERLNGRVTDLSAENARRKSDLRDALKSLGVTSTKELKELASQHGPYATLVRDYSEVKAKVSATPSDVQAECDRLRGELRTIKHTDGFKSLYADKELGLNPAVPVERLQQILGYKAEADAFDAAGVRKAVAALRTSDPYLFAPEAQGSGSGTGTGAAPAAPEAPAWAGRGGSAAGMPAGGVVTQSHLRDPAWMLAYGGGEPVRD